MRRWITELVGTFSLVAVYAWAYAHTPDLAPLVIGGALALLVAGGARRSGAHFNPAISVAFLLRGRLAEGEALRYVAAQLGGATLGAWAVRALAEGPAVAGVYGFDPEAALFVEVILAWALVLVALRDREPRGDVAYALAVGATLTAGLLIGGPISGGAFNPAIGFAPVLAAIGRAPIGHAWIFIVGPLVGGVIAALTDRALSASSNPRRRGERRSGGFLDPRSPSVDIVGWIHRRRADQAQLGAGSRHRR